MVDSISLIETNIHFLNQGIELINDLEQKHYVKTDQNLYKSSVGKHIRHVVEHYIGLVLSDDNRINYDARNRDVKIEKDRYHAVNILKKVVTELEKYETDPVKLEESVWIKNNERSNNSSEPDHWCKSTIGRELQFLVSHTVHHYALIAIILRIQGYYPDKDLGVAPSTLRYRRKKQQETAH